MSVTLFHHLTDTTQRFGALYEHGSSALIERLFRTLKQDLHVAKYFRWPKKPWSFADFERRLVPALIRYSYCRPHSALGGRVPVEAFFGIQDQRPLRNVAPRGGREIRTPTARSWSSSSTPTSRLSPSYVPKAA